MATISFSYRPTYSESESVLTWSCGESRPGGWVVLCLTNICMNLHMLCAQSGLSGTESQMRNSCVLGGSGLIKHVRIMQNAPRFTHRLIAYTQSVNIVIVSITVITWSHECMLWCDQKGISQPHITIIKWSEIPQKAFWNDSCIRFWNMKLIKQLLSNWLNRGLSVCNK